MGFIFDRIVMQKQNKALTFEQHNSAVACGTETPIVVSFLCYLLALHILATDLKYGHSNLGCTIQKMRHFLRFDVPCISKATLTFWRRFFFSNFSTPVFKM
jgi:hypothetical protein